MFVDKWGKEVRNFRKQNGRETTYSVTVTGGEKLFQIQTYVLDGTVKQIIQCDKQRAAELVGILEQEFGL